MKNKKRIEKFTYIDPCTGLDMPLKYYIDPVTGEDVPLTKRIDPVTGEDVYNEYWD